VVHIAGRALPVELAAVIGLLWLTAALLIIPTFKVLPDAFEALGQDELSRAFGALILVAVAILISAGATCIWLGLQLGRADRVSRILTIVLCAAVALAMLASDQKGTDEVLVLLASLGVIAILTISPRVQAFLTGPSARQQGQPNSVVAARALATYLAWTLGVVGVAFLPVGSLAGKYYFVGIGLTAVSVAMFRLVARLSVGDVIARNWVTGLVAAYALLLLISSGDASNMLLPLSVVVATVVLLWVPEESKTHFSVR
jgi:hypothetical protein